jgi:hypothetical protein
VADPVQVKKLTGEIWGEVLSKTRGDRLSIADKVRVLDFLAAEATKLADSVRHGDHDGKIADQAKLTADALTSAEAEASALVILIRESKLHKTQPPGLHDVTSIEGDLVAMRSKMKALLAFYEKHSPSIVDRVGAIQISNEAGGPSEEEDLPF